MAWEAKLTALEKKGGMVYATITYANGSDPEIVQTINGDTLDADAIELHATLKTQSLTRAETSYTAAQRLQIGAKIAAVALPQFPAIQGK